MSLSGVLTASEFERTLRQERARVDRNDRCFSVAVFRVSRRNDAADLTAVAAILRERMRSYDTLGALDSERLALLLPESDGAGAWRLADDVTAQLATEGHAASCEVFTYPVTRGGRDGNGEAESDPGDVGGPRPTPTGSPRDGASSPSLDHSSAGAPRSTGTDGPAPRSSEPLAQTLGSLPISRLRPHADERPIEDLYPAFLVPLPLWRRVIDVAFASALLAFLSPLLLATAVAVKLTSPGSVFFVQWRAGRGGRPFRFYKFRSMFVDADEKKSELAEDNEKDGPIFKMRDDPRITPLGRLLRKFSIDELPQLWNVLKGDMTLVGPRPPTLDEVAAYQRWQRERLDITGGLTCIWQVSGRSEIGFEDWVRMDLEYKRKRSAGLDLRLLWRTIGAVFSGRGAY